MDLDCQPKHPGAEASAKSQGDEERNINLIEEDRDIPQQANGLISKNFGNFYSQGAKDGCSKRGRSLDSVIPEASEFVVPFRK